jgi:hypothetical protein
MLRFIAKGFAEWFLLALVTVAAVLFLVVLVVFAILGGRL